MTKRQKIHADEVLKRFRKRRDTPACYPCSKRKVRCTGGRPCGSCVARGHADICYDEEQGRRRTESPVLTVTDASSSASHVSPATANTTPTQNNDPIQHTPTSDRLTTRTYPATTIPIEPRVGRFSAVTFIRDRLKESSNKVSNGEFYPTVGLANAQCQLPALAPLGISPNSMQPPKREEVLRYYPPFKDCVIPLYPIIPDVAIFESLIHDILTNSSTLEDPQMAMILASLALGAQFEEYAIRPRIPTSLELISRSNMYLQRANYIFQPTLEAIQALLMIGMALQNAGRPDGAWNLLGLNYRLAQTLGLHLLDPNDGAEPGATIWSTIIWQDCLLSCRYDRRPLTDLSSIINLNMPEFSYYQAMRSLCALDMDLLSQPHSRRFDISYVQSVVREVTHLLNRCCEHLSQSSPQDKAWTFHQRLQHGAFKLHSGLFLADLCRPMFSLTAVDEHVHQLRQRGFDALKSNIEAFLEIWSFSNIPLRQWSMTQSTVSCAIVLALIIQDPRTKSSSTGAIIALLRRLIKVLKTGTEPQNPSAVQSTTVDLVQGVCLMRLKGAGLLEAILDSYDTHTEVSSSRDGGQEVRAEDASNATLHIQSLPTAEDLVWPADLPVFDRAFLAESVLDFDVDQGWFEENIPAGFG